MATPQPTLNVAKQVAKQHPPENQLTKQPTTLAGGVRKFEARVFKPWWTRDGERFEAEQYAFRVAHDGRRETVSLNTADLREAARRAARFHAVLKASGWGDAFATLGAEPARVQARKGVPTVGELIAAASTIAVDVKPATLRSYGIALRWLASRVAEIEGAPSRYDYKTGGLERWRAKVDAVSLAELTPKAVKGAVSRYIKARGETPEATRSAASFMRQARGFWSKQLLEVLPFENVPNPFAGVTIKSPRAPRYQPTFNSADLLAAARSELRDADAEAWKAFLMLLGGGLRRSEADAVLWTHVDFAQGVLRVVAGKTADSVGAVPLGGEVLAEFKRLSAQASGLHVLEGDDRPRDPSQRTYRANHTFERLAGWLKQHGVTDKKPLHALRKECGSLINDAAGVHAASRFLRHSTIGVTATHYLDDRNNIANPLFAVAK